MVDILKQIADVHLGPQDRYSKPVNYVVAQNGLFVVKKTQFGEITVKTDEIPILPAIKEEFKLTIPKAPYYLFLQAYSFFKKVAVDSKDEAALVLYYNNQLKKYELYCPEQIVSGASVKFAEDKEYIRRQTDANYIRVCEMHSHNTMSAFHSGTDDKDEIFDCSFLVFGKLTTNPEHIFSFAASGRRVDSSLWDLFERPTVKIQGPNGEDIIIPTDVIYVEVDYPKEWHNMLKKQKLYNFNDYKYSSKTIYGGSYDKYNKYDWYDESDLYAYRLDSDLYKKEMINTVYTNNERKEIEKQFSDKDITSKKSKHKDVTDIYYDDSLEFVILDDMIQIYGKEAVADFVNYVLANKDDILQEVK